MNGYEREAVADAATQSCTEQKSQNKTKQKAHTHTNGAAAAAVVVGATATRSEGRAQEAEFVAKVCAGDLHVAVAARASKAQRSFGVASLKFVAMRFYTVVSMGRV